MGIPEGMHLNDRRPDEEPHPDEDGFVDDDSSSLPPGYFATNKDECRNKSSEQSDPGTAPTVAMTGSLAASTTSFSFEITLPPPADVSPLSCRESVVTAMMARPLDRALEQRRIPIPSLYDEYSGATSPSERRRRSHHRRTQFCADHDDTTDHKSKRSRSAHAISRKDLGNYPSETPNPEKVGESRRSRSAKPISRRSKSTDVNRLSSSRSKSRDIAAYEDKHKHRRHRSKSRSAHDGERSMREPRRILTIAAIKEEMEETLVSPQKIATDKDSQPRQRSRSRQRSPPARERSPSSSRHKDSSKSRKRSPSKSEKRSSSQKPNLRERSKSRTRHRSRSRSHSRLRVKTSEEEAKEYLAMLSGLMPLGENNTESSSSKPSFLSRLAESNKRNNKKEQQTDEAIIENTPLPPKSVECGIDLCPSPSHKAAPSEVVKERKEDGAGSMPSSQVSPRGGEPSREGSRSKSKSRLHRTKNRKRTEAEEGEKPESKRKLKWDELLNASRTSFHFSTDSFSFDPMDEGKSPSPLKTIQPNINPVVLRNGLGSPTYATKTAKDSFLLVDINAGTAPMKQYTVDAIEKDATREEEKTRPEAHCCTAQEISSPRVSETSKSGSDVRMKNARAMILEKRKRKEASKARQEKLDLMKSPPSTMDASDNFEMCFQKSPFEIVQGGTQFSPALRVSNMAVTCGMESTKIELAELEKVHIISSSSPSSRREELKKKMSEIATKSKRTIRPPIAQEETTVDASRNVGEETHPSTSARVSRKERAEARRAKRGQKMGESNSKWKTLSAKAEELHKPYSFRASLQKVEEMSERKGDSTLFQRKESIRGSKWAGVKGGIDFISRVKLKSAESKK
ncbi:hypothetical protein IV203_016515 [Nitzschia inconspicua]|uniref:Uncharacterized protein n=1 Tax=Nitzschia inconspicua TaxID=303405 RepID=A0A9K3KQ57_9STRA|nr:hypothetical protein IV203_016515 [Nitzschia inconspicua]